MRRSDDRILTTHVGSLVRPPELIRLSAEARDDPERRPAYLEALQRETTDIIRRQVHTGIDVVNDGEFGKSSWANYVLDRLGGFEARPESRFEAVWVGRDRFRFREFMQAEFPRGLGGVPGHACVGPIEYRGYDDIRRNIAHVRAALASASEERRQVGPLKRADEPALASRVAQRRDNPGDRAPEGFLTAVAPASTGYDAVNEYYASERDYVFAIADALREEYLEISRAGLILQIDDAVLANMYDELVQQSPQRYRDWAELCVDALNHALRGIPEDRVRYHVCFGSWHAPHMADAPLEAIVDLILKVRAGAYSIEAANVRHEHEWRVWQTVALPPEKVLIPGVVTHHTVSVEHPRLVADRLVRLAGIVGRENVIAGTDCGFAQIETYQRVHPQVMWAKLEALVEGARIASDELW
jgi:5-methyltetrahydropteroyltriglutamate--homocysteine methyltransferase